MDQIVVYLLIQYNTALILGSADIKDIQFEVSGKAGVVINKMKNSVKEECKRVGAWGVLDRGTGAKLIEPGLYHSKIF